MSVAHRTWLPARLVAMRPLRGLNERLVTTLLALLYFMLRTLRLERIPNPPACPLRSH
jgi:hypothetical protein